MLVLAHGVPQLTVIQANQPLLSSTHPILLGQSSVTVNGIQLPGPATRRQERKVTISPNRASVSFQVLQANYQYYIEYFLFCLS